MNKTLTRVLSAIGLRSSVQSTSPRDPALADWWGSSAMSSAGFSVTADTAMREAAVFSCVRVLSEAVASLPLILYRRLPDGGKERATKHPMFSIAGRYPNGWQTRFEWIEQSMIHLCLRGVAYSRIVGNPSGKVQLMPLHPDRVRAVLSDTGRITYEYQPVGAASVVLLQEEVLRVPFMVVDGVTPLSIIGYQREAIGVSMAAQDYGARFFANDARPTGGYVTWEAGNKFRDDEEEKKFRENWQRYMVGPNRHKTAFLKSGMKFNELGMNNEDAQFLETRKFQRNEIAGMFRVPPHMIADLDRATFSNIEHQGIEFVTHTIGPWLARWEQALSRDLLSDADQEDYFFEFLTAGLLRGDSKARADYLKIAISQGGWMNRNEARAIENLNQQNGLDEFLVPVNMTTSDKIGKETPAPVAAMPDEKGPENDD